MKRIAKLSLVFAACVLTLSSCNCYKKMAKKIDDVNVSCNPEVLMLKGNNVVTDVTVTFPEKYYNAKAVMRVTPVLVYDGGEIVGTPKYVQGAKVADNYPVIDKKQGGTYTQTISIPYDPKAQECTLVLRVAFKCNKKNAEFEEVGSIPVAQGVNTLQNDVNYADAMQIMSDNFKRVTTVTEKADIMYVINQSNVRKSQLTSEQIKAFEDFVKEYVDKDRTTLGSIYANGYASPDGPEGFNDRLSKSRSETGKAAISKQLKKVDGLTYDAAAYGEDWEGFKELVEASNIKDKDMILQVLQMYSSPAQRDAEIKNMSSVFQTLAIEILPKLRRTQLVASADIQGKTDAELKAAVENDMSALTLEEMLFAATLYDAPAAKAAIYKTAAEKYNDARAYNNYGVAEAALGNYAAAQAAFEKAAKLGSDVELNNNMALVALAQGKTAEAGKYLASASAETKALASVAEGKYAAATSSLSGYNKAVAEVLNGNLNAAKASLGNLDTAEAEYLRGVIAAKEGNKSAAVKYIKVACEKNPSLKAKALKDVNLKKVITAADLK